ncbi:50S ribosomal protein L10 [Candidatus Dojkabacteria bacterium]|nr:50S ribosomal protein L10 [Candidatus Dojkabacteria bacterium]
MITKTKKQNMLKSYIEELKKVKAVYLFSAKGVAANDITEIKKELKQNNASFKMVKNNIFKLAVDEVFGEGKFVDLIGQVGAVFAFEDAVIPTKLVDEFKTRHKEYAEVIVPQKGILDNEIIEATDIDRLAKLPTRDQLLGQVLSVMVGPVRGFITVSSGVAKSFVQVVKAYGEKKQAN